MSPVNNRSRLLSIIKLCVTYHHHMWIQTGVMVWKWLSWVLTSVTLTFDLWHWLFAWTSLLWMLITPKISWWYNDGNILKRVWQMDGRTDIWTDRQMGWTIHSAAWSQLKTSTFPWICVKWVYRSYRTLLSTIYSNNWDIVNALQT